MTGITRRGLLGAAAGAAGGLAATATPLRAQSSTQWNAYTYIPAATLPSAKGLTRIAEGVEKASNGGFKIRVHLGGSLPIGASDISNALSDDVVQLGDDGFHIFRHGNPAPADADRPPAEEFDKAVAIIRPYFEQAYAARVS